MTTCCGHLLFLFVLHVEIFVTSPESTVQQDEKSDLILLRLIYRRQGPCALVQEVVTLRRRIGNFKEVPVYDVIFDILLYY